MSRAWDTPTASMGSSSAWHSSKCPQSSLSLSLAHSHTHSSIRTISWFVGSRQNLPRKPVVGVVCGLQLGVVYCGKSLRMRKVLIDVSCGCGFSWRMRNFCECSFSYLPRKRLANDVGREVRAVCSQSLVLSGVEGLDKRREKGRCCYGAVYEVELNGVPCIAKRLHDILVSRGQEQKRPVSEEDRRPAIIFTSIYITW